MYNINKVLRLDENFTETTSKLVLPKLELADKEKEDL